VAQAFDPDRGQLSGEALPVLGAERIAFVTSNFNIGLSVSNDGTILAINGGDRNRLIWLNRGDKVLSTLTEPGLYGGVRLSPDGTRAALSIVNTSGGRDVWILDFARGVQTRMSYASGAASALWSPDSRTIVYYSVFGTSIFERDASGAGSQTTLLESAYSV
jgi:Tol biopolymer transport system component